MHCKFRRHFRLNALSNKHCASIFKMIKLFKSIDNALQCHVNETFVSEHRLNSEMFHSKTIQLKHIDTQHRFHILFLLVDYSINLQVDIYFWNTLYKLQLYVKHIKIYQLVQTKLISRNCNQTFIKMSVDILIKKLLNSFRHHVNQLNQISDNT